MDSENISKTLAEAEQKLQRAKLHAEREEKFAVEANDRFSRNLAVFEQYYPEIAKEIKAFVPRDDFCLHVTESGHGNFYPKGASVPLYNADPWQQTLEQVKKNTERPFFSYTQYGSEGEVNPDEILHIQYMQKLNKSLFNIKQNNDKALVGLPKFFPSCLIFGLGLGYHVSILLEQHDFDYVFICEPDIELFFASLFCIDWEKIVQDIDAKGSCLFLNIGVDYDEFFSVMRGVVTDIGAFSLAKSFCYQHYPSKEVNDQIKDFFDRYFELQMGFGFYNDAITGLAHSIYNVEHNAPFFIASKSLNQITHDVPVYVVGNGPSLDEAEALLKATKDNAIVIAAGSALNSLLKMGIKPDFHVLVERPRGNYDILLDTLPREAYSDLNLLAVDVIYPDTLDLYKWTGLGLKGPEAGSELINLLSLQKFGVPMNAMPLCAPMVANTALSFATMMGFKQIYLVGVDNGYSMEGDSHSKYSMYQDDNKVYKNVVDKNAPHIMAGNLSGQVKATSLLKLAKVQMEGLFKLVPDLDVYNIGSGAKIDRAHPTYPEDVLPFPPLPEKQQLVEKIKEIGFKQMHFQAPEAVIDFAQFDEICDYMIEIAKTPFQTRQQAAEILKRQSRYIYSFRGTKYTYLFNMIKGSLLYYHCPLITILFTYEDEQLSLQYFAETLALWNEFVLAMKKDFRENWHTKCDWEEYSLK